MSSEGNLLKSTSLRRLMLKCFVWPLCAPAMKGIRQARIDVDILPKLPEILIFVLDETPQSLCMNVTSASSFPSHTAQMFGDITGIGMAALERIGVVMAWLSHSITKLSLVLATIHQQGATPSWKDQSSHLERSMNKVPESIESITRMPNEKNIHKR